MHRFSVTLSFVCLGAKLGVAENQCVLFNPPSSYVYLADCYHSIEHYTKVDSTSTCTYSNCIFPKHVFVKLTL